MHEITNRMCPLFRENKFKITVAHNFMVLFLQLNHKQVESKLTIQDSLTVEILILPEAVKSPKQ